jgi:hypothetical protein
MVMYRNLVLCRDGRWDRDFVRWGCPRTTICKVVRGTTKSDVSLRQQTSAIRRSGRKKKARSERDGSAWYRMKVVLGLVYLRAPCRRHGVIGSVPEGQNQNSSQADGAVVGG